MSLKDKLGGWFKSQGMQLLNKLVLQVLAYLVTKENIKKLMDWLDELADKTDTEVDDVLVKRIRDAIGV